MKDPLRAVLTVASLGVALGVAWFLFATFGPRLSHEAVAAARLEAVGQTLGKCWDVDRRSLSDDAASATVVVQFGVRRVRDFVVDAFREDSFTGHSGPVAGSIRLDSFSDTSALAAAEAFEAARRVIIRCGRSGFLLPIEKRYPWHDVEATFGPQGVRVR